jgi:hypothetical protein
MSEQAYREFALSDRSGQWELGDGCRRESPAMSVTRSA